MSQRSPVTGSVNTLDDFACTAIPNQDFDPRQHFAKLPAHRLQETVEIGLSLDMLGLLEEVVRARLADNPADGVELQAVLDAIAGR